MIKESNISLDLLFKPKNVAIYEAKDKLYYFISGYEQHGFDIDKFYLINPKEEQVMNIKCYKTIESIPEDTIDLFIIAVRRELIISILKEILDKKKVNFIHFFSAGTTEADAIGEKIELEIKEILNSKNLTTRAIGPNCMGVYCPNGKNTYSPAFPKESGNIGLIFHSGDLHSKMITYGSERYKFRYSKGVSVGNCIDLQISDFLRYFNQDEETDFICIYFEGFPKHHKEEGKTLFKALKEMKKPVLFLRGGRTSRAQTAVLTHTGSLGTPTKMWDAVFKQTHAIQVDGILDDLIDYANIFNEFFKRYKHLSIEERMKFYPKSKKALVILWSGGLGILDTDALTEIGIELPYFEGKTLKKLREVYPLKIGSLSNPLDLPWIVTTDIFVELSKAAVGENIDVVLLETDSPMHWDSERFEKYYNNLKSIRDHVNSLNKFFILILPEYPHPIRNKYYKRLIADGFIVYPSIRRAGKSFITLFQYGKKIKRR
ncbi:MAG: CoA-binding protein [Promethearchaeota archaeon]